MKRPGKSCTSRWLIRRPADPNTGSLAGLPGPVVWSWYGPWTLKGFENRYAVMSDLDHFDYTTVSGVAKLNKPALLIHGDNYMNAAAAKLHYSKIVDLGQRDLSFSAL